MTYPPEFNSDGCSWFPEGDWHECCVQHDFLYWSSRTTGGGYRARKKADQALRRCVASRGHPVIAWIMYIGVRIGGSPIWPTKFRWGCGR